MDANRETVRAYIESFHLEEGGPLSFLEGSASGREIYWGCWYGRKLLYISWSGMSDFAEVGFSLDFAQYEVADFCKHLDTSIGPWQADQRVFLPRSDRHRAP